MAQEKYEYSISGDTSNGKVEEDVLGSEVQVSDIITALDYISTSGDALDVYMKDTLSPGDEASLNTVVSDHEGIPATPPPDEVVIKEFSETSGAYKTKGYNFLAIKNATTDYTFSFPYDVEVLAGEVWTKNSIDGDELELIIAPDTTIGIVTVAGSVDDSEVKVNSTVLDNIRSGRHVKFGSDTDEYVVTSKTADGIEISPNLINAVSVTDAVKMSVKMVESMKLYADIDLRLGWTKIGSSFVGQNTPIRVSYTNVDSVDKDIYFYMDILY